jgi:hypothetical protein
MHKGPRGTEAVESNHVVAIQDVRGLDKKQNGKGWSDEGVSYTVDTHATQGVAMCEIDTVGTLRAHHPGTAGVQSDTDHIVAYAIQERAVCENPDAGPDGIGVRADNAAYTLEARSTPQAVAYSFKPGQSEAAGGIFVTEEYSPTLQAANNGSTAVPAVAYDAAHAFKVRGGCEGGGKGYLGSDEVAFTISTNQDQHIFSEATHEVAGTFKACAGSGGWSNSVDHAAAGYMALMPIGFDAYNNDVTGDVTKTIDTGQDYHHVPNVLQSTVRRLTPVECERLQGFPDNFTAIPWRKKGAEDCPDGPRYKALGNSMAVPVMRWIGERIRLIDDYISII